MTSLRYTFAEKEARCETLFRGLSPCWHLYTAENFEIIFVTDDDFRAGMILIALCAMSFPGIKILAFQLMNNHLHVTLSGQKDECCAFFHMFRHRLQMYLKGVGRTVDLSGWEEKLNAIEDLDYLRTVIAYTNRNGFLVDPDETPFTYRWGTNRFFLQSGCGFVAQPQQGKADCQADQECHSQRGFRPHGCIECGRWIYLSHRFL